MPQWAGYPQGQGRVHLDQHKRFSIEQDEGPVDGLQQAASGHSLAFAVAGNKEADGTMNRMTSRNTLIINQPLYEKLTVILYRDIYTYCNVHLFFRYFTLY